jgi:hypothetical protein
MRKVKIGDRGEIDLDNINEVWDIKNIVILDGKFVLNSEITPAHQFIGIWRLPFTPEKQSYMNQPVGYTKDCYLRGHFDKPQYITPGKDSGFWTDEKVQYLLDRTIEKVLAELKMENTPQGLKKEVVINTGKIIEDFKTIK